MLSVYSWGKKEEQGDIQSDGDCLPKEWLRVIEPCFPGDGWTPACRWEVVTEFLILLCLCMWLLFCLLNWFYLNPWLFSLLLFWPSPIPLGGGVSELLGGAQLPAGVKPQQIDTRIFFFCCLNHNLLLQTTALFHLIFRSWTCRLNSYSLHQ